jgi:hypothetical protein
MSTKSFLPLCLHLSIAPWPCSTQKPGNALRNEESNSCLSQTMPLNWLLLPSPYRKQMLGTGGQ